MKIAGSTILTFGGRYLDPLNLDPTLIALEDVAHALSNQCRYSGHTSSFYSVAEHSVLVSQVAEEMVPESQTERRHQVAMWGLLHDATEAYLIDLPRPLKDDPALGNPYRFYERKAQKAVAAAFGLPEILPSEVHVADLLLLATERRDLMPPVGDWAILEGVEPLPARIRPWSPQKAKVMFSTRYQQLRQGRRAA